MRIIVSVHLSLTTRSDVSPRSIDLKTFREASGFTQDRVASFLSIERGALANYELGTRETPLPVLIRLSNLYGVDIADFYENNSERMKNTFYKKQADSKKMDYGTSGRMESKLSQKHIINYIKND